jgi:hypothetical protein
LVDEVLRQDPELARLAEAQRRELSVHQGRLAAKDARVSPDHELQTLARARAVAERQRWQMALALMFTAFPLSFAFQGGRVTFLLVRDAPVIAGACWIAAAVFWVLFVATRRRLRATGI